MRTLIAWIAEYPLTFIFCCIVGSALGAIIGAELAVRSSRGNRP